MKWIRNHGIDIGRYLPSFITKDKEFRAVTVSDNLEHERLLAEIEKLLNELFIDTAVESLDVWDCLLGINTSDMNIYERRDRIKIELNRNTSSTKAFLERLCNQYISNKSCEIVPNNARYFFDVYFDKNKCFDIDKLKQGLDLYKPAHLGYFLHEVELLMSILVFGGVVIMDEVIEIPAYEPYTINDPAMNMTIGGIITEENIIDIY